MGMDKVEPYHLSARIQLTDLERLEETRHELKKLQIATEAEPKCIQFRIFEDVKEPGTFVLWESWIGREGLDKHYSAEHTRRYFALGLTEIVRADEVEALLR